MLGDARDNSETNPVAILNSADIMRGIFAALPSALSIVRSAGRRCAPDKLAAIMLSFCSVISNPAIAEELGQLTAFIDGEERVWYTITFPQGGATVFTATLEQKQYQLELLVQGHPVQAFTSKDVLSVDARFSGTYQPGDEPLSVEILYTPNGLSGPLWTSRGASEAPRLQIVELNAWGGAGDVTAVVSGEICRRARLFSRTDSSDCKRVNGKIETRLEVR